MFYNSGEACNCLPPFPVLQMNIDHNAIGCFKQTDHVKSSWEDLSPANHVCYIR